MADLAGELIEGSRDALVALGLEQPAGEAPQSGDILRSMAGAHGAAILAPVPVEDVVMGLDAGSDNLTSRNLRRAQGGHQPQVGPRKQGFGGVEFLAELGDRLNVSGVGTVVKAHGEGAGVGIGQQIGLGVVESRGCVSVHRCR